MKLFCEGLDLSDAILKVIKACSNKTTNPILEGIKIKAEDNTLTLTATDSELAIVKKIKADVKIEGETVVPGKFFSEYIKKLSNQQIELLLDENNRLEIKYIDSEVFIQCLNPEEFPDIKTIDSKKQFKIKQQNFKDVISKTIFSVSLEDTRPILKGCLLESTNETLKSVALDGYRLAIAEKPLISTTENFSVIVPGRSLNEINKILNESEEEVSINIQENYLMIEVDSTIIITRLLDGEFINYKQIIPVNNNSQITINKNQLEDALERASILTRISGDNSVKLKISENILTLTAKSEIGNVTENITISLKGDDLQIAFDSRFLKECLRVSTDEFLKISFTSSINPCIITPNEGSEYLFLILPLKQIY